MRCKKGTKVMRFRKGSMVEVFRISETIPSGLWRPAQILCGNGRAYSVQYDCAPSNVEKVERRVIRPCPPVKDNKPVKWVPGDVAEALVHGAWRVGKVTGVAYGNNFYFVVLIGHARELAVKVCNLRRRQIWENNRWLLIKKDPAKEEFKGESKQSGSAASSTGSCSSTRGRPYQYPVFTRCDDDAESVIAFENEEERDGKIIKREANKHELEEYRSIMVKLHENGSITWEQEASLSDLRISLNISIDQHKSILRNLAPSR